jgi:hypothetical protein
MFFVFFCQGCARMETAEGAAALLLALLSGAYIYIYMYVYTGVSALLIEP